MRSISATEAARNFSRLLDDVVNGESIVITREGRPVGRLSPESSTTADRLVRIMEENPLDAAFMEDVEEARRLLRGLPPDAIPAWPDE